MASAWERKYHHSVLDEAAAFLPRLLAEAFPIETLNGVLLFADMSDGVAILSLLRPSAGMPKESRMGFTSLTEKFIQRYGTDRGADGLAQTLNCYLCDILEEILTFGGDILKFAGDAVLVLWRTQSLQPQVLAKTISLVLQCSLQIQEKYGSCDTEVGQKIHLKIGMWGCLLGLVPKDSISCEHSRGGGRLCILSPAGFAPAFRTGQRGTALLVAVVVPQADSYNLPGYDTWHTVRISAGHMNLLLVRGARQQYFCIWGKALVDVREAGELANAGEIILSGTSWEQCEQHRLRIRHLEGKREVKVMGMDRMSLSERQDAFRSLKEYPMCRHLEREGVMRPSLRLPNMEALRKYIPEAALRKLDDHMPLDVFSELRPVTSLFIHLQFPRDISVDYLRSILNEASRMMIEILIPHKGELSKIILFDKGCTFLCVFGLTGEKLSYESLHALQSALQIFNSCSATLKGVKAVSAAVSSGMVFCGVTGHPLRHEYTVIGQKVNMAARMMMHYPGLVSCDAATYAASQLPPNYFKELPETKMKGLSHPGTIYQYVGIPKESCFQAGSFGPVQFPWESVDHGDTSSFLPAEISAFPLGQDLTFSLDDCNVTITISLKLQEDLSQSIFGMDLTKKMSEHGPLLAFSVQVGGEKLLPGMVLPTAALSKSCLTQSLLVWKEISCCQTDGEFWWWVLPIVLLSISFLVASEHRNGNWDGEEKWKGKCENMACSFVDFAAVFHITRPSSLEHFTSSCAGSLWGVAWGQLNLCGYGRGQGSGHGSGAVGQVGRWVRYHAEEARGQQKEIDLFVSCLKAYEDLGKSHILAFEGTRGSGKSHLLTELARLGQAAGHRVVAVELLEVNMRQSFSAIHMLMARALGLQECEACSAREHVLQTKLEGTIEKSSYCLFNDIFCVKFPISDEVRKLHETHRKMKMHSTWAKVLEKTIGGEFGIFVIDNAHFIDPASWSIMSPVLCNTSLFMVVSLAPGYARTKFFCKAAADNTVSQNITYLHLGQLKPSDVVKKVCEDLGVVSISRDLARFLIQRSAGIPYYCEELLHCLRCNNMLSFHTQRQHGKAEDNWQSLIMQAASAIEASALAATSNSSAGHDGRVCTIRPDVNLENAVLPVTLKDRVECIVGCLYLLDPTLLSLEIVLAQLDQIALLKQKVLKFAAVIGPVFTTQMLLHILPASIRLRMNPLLDMLVGNNILMWLKKTEVPEDVQDPTKGAATSLRAKSRVKRPSPCKKTTEGQSGVLAFCAPLVQETAYELWPERQRVALHRKCAAFLEQHAHKCKSCGQGDFVAFHRFAVTSTQDRESCWGPADQGNSHSWEALVFAGEWLKRDRTNTTEDALQQQQQSAFMEEDFGVARGFLATSKQTTELPSKTDGKSNSTCSCECKAIVESVLVPLARHCMAMGDAGRALYYLLECAAAYLHVSNSYMALMKLNEAEALRNSVEEQANVIARFEQATFFSLKGEVCCHMGYMKLAKKMIRKALSLLRRQFPKTSVGVVVKFCVETLPWARRASSLPQEVRRKKLAWLLRQSWCLSLLEHLFSLEGTSSRRTRSLLAVRMKANTDRAVNHYWAEDSSHK
ncbi:adenylate cyclase type 10 [Rhynochetos jubatus]